MKFNWIVSWHSSIFLFENRISNQIAFNADNNKTKDISYVYLFTWNDEYRFTKIA